MNTHMSGKRATRVLSRHGFSLMELMIVVVITGVLAAIAIPTFTGYIQKSRTSEAVQFLGVIKLRQESYRAEFGQYLGYGSPAITDPTAIVFVPATPSSRPVQFPTTDAYFNALGAKPDGAIRFGYGWAAGTPATSETALTNTYGLGNTHDHYFIAQALGDLDDDRTFCTFELTSFTRAIWFTPVQGWE